MEDVNLIDDDDFGDKLLLKEKNILRIGFQNIGGISINKDTAKDDIIRVGIGEYDFDIFGFSELNIDWRNILEEDRLYARTRYWWDSSNIMTANNCTTANREAHQYGGTALFSIGKAAHRIISKGIDPTNLGRWVWVRYRGRNNQTLRIFSAYRPNPPGGGPFTVYAQHRQFFNSRDDERCPRAAFLDDLCSTINEAKEEGDNIIVMLDGNDDMRKGAIHQALSQCQLREAVISKHGPNTPFTHRRNKQNVPIDGIWLTPSLEISACGFKEFDAVFPGTDHRTIWLELSFITAFGHNMPPIAKPRHRRLQCNDPRCVANYNRSYERFVRDNMLLEQAKALEERSNNPLSQEDQKDYERLDVLWCQGVELAERRCRKLRMGQVAFSPSVQAAMRSINAWSMLIRRVKGLRVSSRLLQRTMRKASLEPVIKTLGIKFMEENLHLAYRHYYDIKGHHLSLRDSLLDTRAEAWAEKNNTDKATMIRMMKQSEAQCATSRKLKHIRGKLSMGSTTVVSVRQEDG